MQNKFLFLANSLFDSPSTLDTYLPHNQLLLHIFILPPEMNLPLENMIPSRLDMVNNTARVDLQSGLLWWDPM